MRWPKCSTPKLRRPGWPSARMPRFSPCTRSMRPANVPFINMPACRSLDRATPTFPLTCETIFGNSARAFRRRATFAVLTQPWCLAFSPRDPRLRGHFRMARRNHVLADCSQGRARIFSVPSCCNVSALTGRNEIPPLSRYAGVNWRLGQYIDDLIEHVNQPESTPRPGLHLRTSQRNRNDRNMSARCYGPRHQACLPSILRLAAVKLYGDMPNYEFYYPICFWPRSRIGSCQNDPPVHVARRDCVRPEIRSSVSPTSTTRHGLLVALLPHQSACWRETKPRTRQLFQPAPQRSQRPSAERTVASRE